MAQEHEKKDIQCILNDGNKICYHDTGSGNATVVLVSGATLGLGTWEGFQDRLSKYARIISYDRINR